jgi:hypothetical protein
MKFLDCVYTLIIKPPCHPEIAISGAGLGSILGNVLRKDESLGDAITGEIGRAAPVGACSVYNRFEESKDNRTNFAAVLADTIKEVEDELQYIIQGQL